MSKIFKRSYSKGRIRIECIGILADNGLIISILGGEASHIGAVATATPRPSMKDPRKISATSSVLTLLGHKDDEVARPAAELAAKKLNRTAVVIAGIHVERPTKKEISNLVTNSRRCVTLLIENIFNNLKSSTA